MHHKSLLRFREFPNTCWHIIQPSWQSDEIRLLMNDRSNRQRDATKIAEHKQDRFLRLFDWKITLKKISRFYLIALTQPKTNFLWLQPKYIHSRINRTKSDCCLFSQKLGCISKLTVVKWIKNLSSRGFLRFEAQIRWSLRQETETRCRLLGIMWFCANCRFGLLFLLVHPSSVVERSDYRVWSLDWRPIIVFIKLLSHFKRFNYMIPLPILPHFRTWGVAWGSMWSYSTAPIRWISVVLVEFTKVWLSLARGVVLTNSIGSSCLSCQWPLSKSLSFWRQNAKERHRSYFQMVITLNWIRNSVFSWPW